MNTENKDQFVYVPVSVDDELPPARKDVFCIQNGDEYLQQKRYIPEICEWFEPTENRYYPKNQVTHWLKKVPISSLLPKTIIEPANTSARLDSGCDAPLTDNNSIEQISSNPYKAILQELLLQIEFGGLNTTNLLQFLSEQLKNHSITVGINHPAKMLGMQIQHKK